MKKVSIVVPVYNTEKYLRKCLNSLVGQTLEDIEIIVVNDGSPDNSQAIIDEYMKNHPSVVKGISQKNAGLSAARNAGLKKATGEYVSFVDSDDYVDIDMTETLYNYASQNGLDILGFGYKELQQDRTLRSVSTFSDEPVQKQLMIKQTMACNKLFRREFLEENQLQFVSGIYYEDLEFVPRAVALTEKVAWLDVYPYNYIIRGSSIMHQKKFNPKFHDIFLVLDTLEKSIGKEFPEELEYLYIEHLLFSAAGRFLAYKERKELINKISLVMKQKFPNWKNNRYFKKRNLKYRLFCAVAYKRQISNLLLLAKLRSMI